MRTSAEAEGAYRFLENERVRPESITQGMCMSTASRCGEDSIVYIATDQTDLTFTDRQEIRGLGPDGANATKHLRATQVMNALALDEEGVPIGMLDQQWWLRSEDKAPDWNHDTRPPEQRESWHWITATRAATRRLRHAAPTTRPWFIYDRGGDYKGLFRCVMDEQVEMTVRVAQNRVVDHKGHRRKLIPIVRRQPVGGHITVQIPPGLNRRARTATCEVRFVAGLGIRLAANQVGTFSAVRVRETGYVPTGQERICWTLLTTHPVSDFSSAQMIIRGYTYRWRVEEVHKTWKTGACRVEQSQLRSYAAIRRWATILVAVAVRVERLKRLSRAQPTIDACTEFSQEELDAAIYLTKSKQWRPGDQMSLADAVRLVAMAGGYLGRKNDGPPGSITIRRGLERITPAAIVLRTQKSGYHAANLAVQH